MKQAVPSAKASALGGMRPKSKPPRSDITITPSPMHRTATTFVGPISSPRNRADDSNDHRRRAARQRIDLREIAMRIGFRQEQHVADMQHGRGEQPGQAGGIGPREEEVERDAEHAFGQRQHDHEGETVAAALTSAFHDACISAAASTEKKTTLSTRAESSRRRL